jgi:hypothetical protein
MNPERRLGRRPGIVARRIAGETILVPVRRRAQEMGLLTLNEVGTFVWERLDGERSLGEIVRAVVGEFEVDEAAARTDLLGFLGQLEEAGCIEEERR